MRATPLMLAIALGLGLSAGSTDAAAPSRDTTLRADALRTYILVFDESPAATFRGFPATDKRRPQLAGTSRVITGASKYNARSLEAVAYVDYLADLRRSRLDDASLKIGRAIVPLRVYSHAMNGVALELTAAEAATIATVPGVRAIAPEFTRRVQTDKGPGWINADEIWNGTIPGVGSHRGEGVIVGVIDTGINRTHNAFLGTGITNPLPGFVGYCASNPAACNSKLIGLWDFTNGAGNTTDPVDNDGHGTHTASTAAGNPFSIYSGVAPRANIIAYKACPDDTCSGAALLASIDRAVADGVDVINYSIGGGQEDPWQTIASAATDDAEAFLAVREAGIVAAVAAGNDGPNPGTLTNPGNSPWVFGVAAATHDRSGIANADRLALFSGRGPVVPFSVLKPDITAPGVSIIAAGTSGNTSIAQLSGTSMATPHVAGAAALLKSINPAFTADQIMSALSLTARNSVKITNSVFANPHEQGSGMTDVALAARAGAYMEVAPNAFRNARANVYSGNSHNLNLPSLAHGSCFQSCVLTRSFKLMPGASAANYSITSTIAAGATITPSVTSFNTSAGGSSVNFTINVSAPSLIGKWVYGTVTLVNNSGDGRPNLKLPIAVYSAAYSNEADAISQIAINAPLERGFVDVNMGSLVPLPNARFVTTELATPKVVTTNIAVDGTNNDPYDSVAGNYTDLVTVPASPAGGPVTYKVRVTTSAASPDIDLYVGRDSNANGLPDEAEELCVSGSSGSSEVCELTVTTSLNPQTYWLMAQNYSGAGTNVRIESFAIGLVPGNGTTLRATGPGNLAANTAFKVRLGYDDATMVNGTNRIGYLFLQPTPGSTIVEIPVRITRNAAGFAPFALAPGVARAVTLPAGSTHDTLVFDVPANATAVSFATTGTGSVSLYAARVASPTSPAVAAAPARNAPGVLSSTAAGADQSILVNGGNLQPGRWYVTPVNTGGTLAQVNVTANIVSSGATLSAKPGSYYNAGRGGHGVFFYPSGADHALLWYTYLQDGSPTWYYVQGAQPAANGVYSATIYRSAWNGSTNFLTSVGNMVITPSTNNTFSMAYNLDGFTGVEPMQSFLTGCPTVAGSPLNVSTHWYNAARAGYGYSTQVNPNYEFHSVFAYDGTGVPRFLVAERSGAFNAAGAALPLEQLAGFPPLGAYVAPTRATIGTLTRTYGANTISTMASSGTFVAGIPGTWNETGAMTALSGTQGCTP